MPTHSVPTLLVRLLFLVLALAMVLLLSSARVDAAQPVETVDYRVTAGDTLWDIAGDVAAAGDDLRVTVSLIKDLNDLDGSTIRPGQVLAVPRL